jgi:hypothetical protein
MAHTIVHRAPVTGICILIYQINYLCSENFYKFENILPGMRRKVNIGTLMVFRNQRRRRRRLYDWFTFSPDYVCGMKQKLRTSRNKISMQIPVTGARCTIVWAIRDDNAPYWRTHHF